MAKFLAELLGCTLPDKGTSTVYESRCQSHVGVKQSTKQKKDKFCSPLCASSACLQDSKWESLWKPLTLRLLVIIPYLFCVSPQERMPQTPPFAAMFDSSGYNRNLYQSKEDNCGGLYYHDNNLLSGSLEALIQHLVPNVDYYPDRTYIFTFLLSSRLFMHPYELMAKVCHLCIEQQRLSEPGLDKNRIRKIAPKILQLLTEWTETFPYDFRDERMMRNLKELAQRIASGDEMYWKNVQQLLQNLIRKLATVSQYEEVLAKINATSTDRLTVLKTKPQSIQRDIITVCNDPYALAQQLTHIELERLNYIGPEEFVQAFVQKDPLDNDK
ncbi:RGF1B protein, partial [Fregata magnificens]|nr:RGF1B protein [Fregata magnificens]